MSSSWRWDWLWIPMIWLLSLVFSAFYTHTSWGIPILLLRIWSHTGLFILAHDAMHGSLFPGRPRWNRGVGSLCLGTYACLPFDHCCQLHHQHHALTGESGDPDGCHGRSFLGWYRHFMGHYVSRFVCLGLLLTWLGWFGILVGLGWSVVDSASYVITAIVVPLLGSSLQLFIFGTFLPHQTQTIRTYPWPIWLSGIACYHFSYHQEHHRFPHQPWYRLPSLYM